MTPDERAAAKAAQRMLQDIFGRQAQPNQGSFSDAIIMGCGCAMNGPTACDSCDPYHLSGRAVRRSDVRYSTLEEIMAGK